jgi:hypothetical protein
MTRPSRRIGRHNQHAVVADNCFWQHEADDMRFARKRHQGERRIVRPTRDQSIPNLSVSLGRQCQREREVELSRAIAQLARGMSSTESTLPAGVANRSMIHPDSFCSSGGHIDRPQLSLNCARREFGNRHMISGAC